MRKILIIVFFFLYFITHPRSSFSYFPAPATQNQFQGTYNFQNNQHLVVWTDCRDIPTSPAGYNCYYSYGQSSDVFGQIINTDGSCFGSNFNIFSGRVGYELSSTTYNPNNNEYLVVAQGLKEDYLSLPNSYGVWQEKGVDIFGQRISNNGAKIGQPFKIAPNPRFLQSSCFGHFNNPAQECDDHQWHPTVAFSTQDNRYMVVWHDGRTRAQNYSLYDGDTTIDKDLTTFKDIYGQIVGSDGNLIGDNFPVAIDNSNTSKVIHGNALRIQQYADITYDGDKNRFFVVWEDDRDGTGSPHPNDQYYDRLNLNIYGGFFNTNGRPINPSTGTTPGNNIEIDKSTGTAERYPKVTFNPVSKEFLVVWQSAQMAPLSGTTYPGDYLKVYAQIIDANGNKKGDRILIENQAKLHDRYYDESYPPRAGVSVNPTDGKYLVTWENAFHQLKGKWIEPNGTVGSTFDLSSSIEGSKVLLGNNYLITGYKRINPAPDNFPTFVFKNQSMPDFANCPASGSQPTNPPVSPSPTPTNIASPSPTVPPLPTETVTPTPGCIQSNGDANDDGVVTIYDYEIWRREFLQLSQFSHANFDCQGGVTIYDYEIWRSNFPL